MINRTTVIDGKRWGRRLGDRLRSPPRGIERWLRRHALVVKDEPSRIVGYLHVRERPCFLKLYRGNAPLRQLARLGFGRPRRSYRVGLELAARGVAVPRPLTCVLAREGVLVLSESLESGSDYCQRWQAGPGRQEARDMMRAAGQTLAATHAAGFTHGDCKWSNLLWSDGTCYLVDFDGARRPRLLAARRRARDVARFAVSAEEAGAPLELLEEFFDSYLAASGDERDGLLQRMQPHLGKLRHRHRDKYGISPQPLV